MVAPLLGWELGWELDWEPPLPWDLGKVMINCPSPTSWEGTVWASKSQKAGGIAGKESKGACRC